MKKFFDAEIPKLGFGLMRLPRLSDGTTIDVEQTMEMTDLFLEAGMKYFDTAYVYEGSEEAARKALVERHPRESYYLTSKLNAGSWCAPSAEAARRQLEISLERTGAGYLDFYLLHALGRSNLDNYERYGIWDYAREAKEKGLVRHVGFSFHDSPEVLEEILNKHPESEFVQLQINWADWDSPSVCSRANYELCVKYDKPVIVMEPVKGGTLANPVKNIGAMMKEADPGASLASWAVRYCASLDQVMVVLSGMSNLEQMRDNLSYMKNFKPLDEKERKVIARAQQILAETEQIPCTSCHYCTGGCPSRIPIPELFKAMNFELIYGNTPRAKNEYENAVKKAGKASDCIHCLQCEEACPQHIEITSWLEKAAQIFD